MNDQPILIKNKKTSFNLFLLIIAFTTLVCIAFAAVSLAFSNIKSFDKDGTPAFITVVGEGKINVLPDSATITVTIRDSGPTVAYAKGAVDVRTKNLIADLEVLTIDKKDIRFLSYSTRPKYETYTPQCKITPCKPKYELVGYETMQTMQIKAYKVEIVGEIINTLDRLDINEISGPNFALEDSEKPRSEARMLAIKNSQSKAEAISKALGTELGKVLKFEEDNNISKYPIYFAKPSSAKSSSESANSSPGEDVVKAKVTVTYALK